MLRNNNTANKLTTQYHTDYTGNKFTRCRPIENKLRWPTRVCAQHKNYVYKCICMCICLRLNYYKTREMFIVSLSRIFYLLSSYFISPCTSSHKFKQQYFRTSSWLSLSILFLCRVMLYVAIVRAHPFLKQRTPRPLRRYFPFLYVYLAQVPYNAGINDAKL